MLKQPEGWHVRAQAAQDRPGAWRGGGGRGVEACQAQSLGVAASLPLRAATDGGRGILQRLGFLPLQMGLVWRSHKQGNAQE